MTLPTPTAQDAADNPMASKDLYLRLLGYVKPYWRIFLVSIIAMIVLAATEPAMPALLKPMLDGSFVEKDPDTIRLIPLLLILLFLIRGLSSYISTVAITWVANKVVLDLREAMFRRLLSLPATYYDHHPSGTLISKITYDVTQVTTAATNVLVVVVRDSLAILGLLAWMFYLNWKLSLIIFLVAPFIALTVKVVSHRFRSVSRSLQNTMGDMTHILEEAITANKVVKIFHGQPYEERRFQNVANWVRRYYMKLTNVSAANVPVVQMIAVLALAAIVYIASLQSVAGEITVGSFVSFFGAMAMLFSPIKRLTSINEHLQKGLAAAESIFALLDEPAEEDPGTRTLVQAQGELKFDNVTFHYPGENTAALENIDLIIRAGETVALVGPSGGGKSTLVNLIPRFYKPDSGVISLDGIDLQKLTLDSLRKQIAFVSQDIVLFNDTVAANIAYGLDNASVEDIERAADAAHAMEFIRRLPQGINTQVGERGALLSGGQRQRLAIARAILKNAPVLIMDEATSALDTQSERHVQAALENLQKDKTTIIIAHRLSTVENADRIVVLQQGRIAEAGTHGELLQREGLYKQLYSVQFAPLQRATQA